MSVLDTHVHVWDAAAIDYPWLADAAAMPAVALPGDIDDADGEASGVIVVEADAAPAAALDEARWLAALDWPARRGIVAAADLAAPGLADRLDALGAVGGVIGIRHLLQGIPVADWPADAFAAGFAELARRGLTFDACVRHEQLDALADLLERAPDTRVVLDHLGKPPVDAGLDSPAGKAWDAPIRRLAALPNVFVKVSGLAAESSDAAAYRANAPGFVAAAVEAFAAERAMIGSDWPVSARAGVGTTLADWIALVDDALAPTVAEREALHHGTAERCYLGGGDGGAP